MMLAWFYSVVIRCILSEAEQLIIKVVQTLYRFVTFRYIDVLSWTALHITAATDTLVCLISRFSGVLSKLNKDEFFGKCECESNKCTLNSRLKRS